jgi:hypothetical protein
MVLLVGELNPIVETYVWDLFFVKGSIVIIRVALTVLAFLQDTLTESSYTFDSLYTTLDEF